MSSCPWRAHNLFCALTRLAQDEEPERTRREARGGRGLGGDNRQGHVEKDYLVLERASASRPSGEWNDDDFDVLADEVVVGRIFKAPRKTGALLQPVRTSGGSLGRLDLQNFVGARDRDRPGLHRLRDFAH
jgi:hypothetical protein